MNSPIYRPVPKVGAIGNIFAGSRGARKSGAGLPQRSRAFWQNEARERSRINGLVLYYLAFREIPGKIVRCCVARLVRSGVGVPETASSRRSVAARPRSLRQSRRMAEARSSTQIDFWQNNFRRKHQRNQHRRCRSRLGPVETLRWIASLAESPRHPLEERRRRRYLSRRNAAIGERNLGGLIMDVRAAACILLTVVSVGAASAHH